MILNTICNQNANSLHKSLPPLQTMHPLQKYFADVDSACKHVSFHCTQTCQKQSCKCKSAKRCKSAKHRNPTDYIDTAANCNAKEHR